MKKKPEEADVKKKQSVPVNAESSAVFGLPDGPSVNQPLPLAVLRCLIRDHDENGLKKAAKNNSPVIVAALIEKLTVREAAFYFSTVPAPYSSDCFSYLGERRRIAVVKALDSKSLAAVMQGLHTDDLTDFVAILPRDLTDKVLGSADKNKKLTVEDFLSYPKDSTGTIMTSEFFAITADMTSGEALALVRKRGPAAETVRTVFVLDGSERLLGLFDLQELLFKAPATPVADFMIRDFVSVNAKTDREEMVRLVRQYDVPVLPVIDDAGRMLGIVTFDDAMDVAAGEDTEDAQKAAGITPNATPYLQTRPVRIARSYIPWLIALLVLNTFTGMLISYFDSLLVAIPLFTAFIPAINDTCGDSGDQTSSTITRELAIGNITGKDYWRVAWKELRAAFVTAAVVAVFNFGWALVELYSGIIESSGSHDTFVAILGPNVAFPLLAGLVSLTFLVCITFGKLLACTLPFLARAVRIDPAVMSGPLIASISDIAAMAVYLLVSIPVLQAVGVPV